jgi:pimeloyl-ACP methyl ester carboxylesterase
MGPSWREGLDGANKDELAAIEAGEPALRDLLEGWAEHMRQVKTGSDITDDPEFSRFYAPVDLACLQGELLDFAVEARSLSVTPGVDGWIDDDFAFWGDWGFDLSHISVSVSIWQGGVDTVIPRAHAEWLTANIPGAQLRFQPEDGHVSLLSEHFGEMLDELIKLGR